MTELNYLNYLSFPDFNVTNIKFESTNRYLKIQVDGAWLKDEKQEKELGQGDLKFESWADFNISQYNSNLDKWINIPLNEFEAIKDICEIQSDESQVYIRGFGNRSGMWIEYKINSPRITIEFQDIE